MISVRFTEDRGSRVKGDVARFDDASAAYIVGEGAAEFVDVPGDVVPEEGFTPPEGFKLASAEDGD